MKTYLLAAAAALVLAGCGAIGGGEKAAMVKSCVAGGESDANCTCIADKLEAALDKDTFKSVATAIAAGEEEGNAMMEALPADKQGAVMGALMTAGMTCMMGGAEAPTP
jgi:hypothetical protein